MVARIEDYICTAKTDGIIAEHMGVYAKKIKLLCNTFGSILK